MDHRAPDQLHPLAADRQARLEEQRSLLDYVIGSIDRLQSNLGARDRVKLSNYLDSIRDIERRIEKAEAQNYEMRLPDMKRPAGTPSARKPRRSRRRTASHEKPPPAPC